MGAQQHVQCLLLLFSTVSSQLIIDYYKKPGYGQDMVMTQSVQFISVFSIAQCAMECSSLQTECNAFYLSPKTASGVFMCLPVIFDLYNNALQTSPGYSLFHKDTGCGYGNLSSSDSPVETCADLPPGAPSDTYWIDPDGGTTDNAFQAFCDMDTDGGGWTLVYRYTFTAPDTFNKRANAVTPIPNWPVSHATTTVSLKPPINEFELGAMDFDLWKLIGSDFLLKSNVVHWVNCSADQGSLVTWISGTVSCTLVKAISENPSCNSIPGNVFAFDYDDYGPSLSVTGGNLFYYWDGNENDHWPTHDPCSKNKPNHVKGLPYLAGGIYLRRT